MAIFFTSILSKTPNFHVIFFKLFIEAWKTLLPCSNVVKNVNSVKTLLHYGQNRQQDALFPDFPRKNLCCHAHIMSNNVNSLRKTLLLCPYLVKKTSILSKTKLSNIILLDFHEKPLLTCPYLVKDT